MSEEKSESAIILDKLNSFLDELKEDHNINSMVFMVASNDDKEPIVTYHGSQLDYTELAVFVSSIMRKEILNRIGG